jgi:diacylglycerol O-acyltransferase / wax synthase
MERLGPVDSLFLDVEKSGPPVAVGAASELSGEPPTLAELRAFVASRLDGMPRFRQRVEDSRTRVRSPKWVDVEPELEHHVRAVDLAAGESLDPAVSGIMEVPMDRDRPLWDIHLITGYSTSKWSLVIRLHHSIADGQGALILIGHLIDMTPDGSFTLADAVAMQAPDHDETESSDEHANRLETVSSSIMGTVDAGFEVVGEFISTYPDTLRALVDFVPRRPSRLTGTVSGKRTWVSGHYPLGPVKQARKAYRGATINDIVLASVAMGFTALLESRGEDPDGRTLRAGPVAVGRDGPRRAHAADPQGDEARQAQQAAPDHRRGVQGGQQRPRLRRSSSGSWAAAG